MLPVILILAGPMLVTAVFVTEVFVGLPAGRRRDAPMPEGRVSVVIPAHDEASIIARTLAELLPAVAGWAELLVVADNCEDQTAQLARTAGGEVIERFSATERGKGFALAFAQAHLRRDPPAAVVVIDADCSIDRESLLSLAGSAIAIGRPCQAINLIRPDRQASPLVQMSTFAFMIKNLVRQRGLQRLAGRVHLTGTGMALPWGLFGDTLLASANIVEDVELGLRLERLGYPALLVESAHVWSDSADASGTLVQRTRWEGGFLALAARQVPRLVGAALRRADPRALWGALDLAIPPLALLALIDATALVVGAAAAWSTSSGWPAVWFHVVLLAAAAGAIVIAWFREGRRFIGTTALARIPLYVLWKIPLYLGLLRGGPRDWLRTGR